MRRPLLAFAVIALASTRAAAADDATSPFEAKPTAVYAVFGRTPEGWMGAEVEQTLAPNASVSAGAGWGLAGPQAAAMLRMLSGGERSKFTLGAGVSGGKYSWKEFCFDCDDLASKSGTVAWANLEIGGEHRFWSGFALRYFGGYGHIIAGDLACDDSPTASPSAFDNCVRFHQDDGKNIVYTGIALGGAF